MESIEERDSFADKSRAFLNEDVPFLHCETAQQRNLVLDALNANICAVKYIIENDEVTILSRETSRKDILTEDHIPKDKLKGTFFQIFRTVKDDN